jgi:hypothetical protein
MTGDLITTQVVGSGIAVYALQILKGAKWFPPISEQSQNHILRIWSAIVAALTALGIAATFDPTVGVLTITGLTITSIQHFAGAWIRSFVFQEIIYRTAVKK